MRKTNYNKRTWLNSEVSDSTGSLVCFDGTVTTKTNESLDWSFLEISDCRNKVRLHRTEDDSKEDFLRKLKTIKREVSEFINFLENN